MKNLALNQDLGIGRGAGTERDILGVSARQPKLWIISAIGAAAGLASSLIGGSAASSAARASERRQREQEGRENAWYKRRYNENYVDTSAGQNLVRRAKDIYDRDIRRTAGAKAVAGGTDQSVAQAKEAANKAVGDTISNIAATDQQTKAQVDNMHRQAQELYAQQDMAREMQRAQNITNAAQNASNAIMSAAGAIEQASVKAPNIAGGRNNSKTMTQIGREVGAYGKASTGSVTGMADNAITKAVEASGRTLADEERLRFLNRIGV